MLINQKGWKCLLNPLGFRLTQIRSSPSCSHLVKSILNLWTPSTRTNSLSLGCFMSLMEPRGWVMIAAWWLILQPMLETLNIIQDDAIHFLFSIILRLLPYIFCNLNLDNNKWSWAYSINILIWITIISFWCNSHYQNPLGNIDRKSNKGIEVEIFIKPHYVDCSVVESIIDTFSLRYSFTDIFIFILSYFNTMFYHCQCCNSLHIIAISRW